MSHLQKIKSGFVDVNCLRAALAAFGWSLEENTKMKTYAGDPRRHETFEYVAVNPCETGYDLGFNRDAHGQLETFGDFFGGSLTAAFGQDLCELKRVYGKKVFCSEWEMQGYTVFESVDNQGNIVLEAELA